MSPRRTPVFAPRIQGVIDHDMCIACGACVAACPPGAIEPTFDETRGAHEVRISDPGSCGQCAAPCEAVCPSLDVDLTALLRASTSPIERQGPICSTWIGYSREHRDDGVSSSGGILRAFVHDSLSRGRPVICLSEMEGDYKASTLNAVTDLARVPGSIYHSISFADAIPLLRELPRPCLLVAIPCHLEGIQKYISEVEPQLEDVIEARIGLVCGWMYTRHSLSAFAAYKNIDESILDARYRGQGEVGLLALRTTNGTHTFDRRSFSSRSERIDYQASFSRYANRLRCRVCEDHTNALADIAVGDAWLERKQGQKSSIVVVRTAVGEAELALLRRSSALELEPARPSDLVESQSENFVYGIEAKRLGAYLRARDISTPIFTYDTTSQPTAPSTLRKLQFTTELYLRRQLRRKRYGWFRWLYSIWDRSRTFGSAVQRKLRRIRRSSGVAR